MHIFAWVVIAVIGVVFLVTGWSPFPFLLGGRSYNISGKYIRLMGACFALGAALPTIGYRYIEYTLVACIILLLIGLLLLVVGMVKATTGKAL